MSRTDIQLVGADGKATTPVKGMNHCPFKAFGSNVVIAVKTGDSRIITNPSGDRSVEGLDEFGIVVDVGLAAKNACGLEGRTVYFNSSALQQAAGDVSKDQFIYMVVNELAIQAIKYGEPVELNVDTFYKPLTFELPEE